jgi:hypothetical protein
MSVKPLVSKKYLLQRFNTKGGWTYILLPEIPQDRSSYFGLTKVTGTIDGLELGTLNLMPSKGGLFMPVNAAIRKKIGKQAGDEVMLELYADVSVETSTSDLIDCLKDEPAAYEIFLKRPTLARKAWIDEVNALQDAESRVRRIVSMIEELLRR